MFNFKEVRNGPYCFKLVSMSLVCGVSLSPARFLSCLLSYHPGMVALEGKSGTASFPLLSLLPGVPALPWNPPNCNLGLITLFLVC